MDFDDLTLPDPDDDIETVFNAIDAQTRAEALQEHNELLSSFFRDGLRIRHLDTSADITKSGLDVSTLAVEAKGSIPKEWADVNPRS